MSYYMMVKCYVLTYRTDDPDACPTTMTFTSYKKAMTHAKELAKDEKVIDILIGLPSKV
jgi:hypothetical protein